MVAHANPKYPVIARGTRDVAAFELNDQVGQDWSNDAQRQKIQQNRYKNKNKRGLAKARRRKGESGPARPRCAVSPDTLS